MIYILCCVQSIFFFFVFYSVFFLSTCQFSRCDFPFLFGSFRFSVRFASYSVLFSSINSHVVIFRFCLVISDFLFVSLSVPFYPPICSILTLCFLTFHLKIFKFFQFTFLIDLFCSDFPFFNFLKLE